MIESFMFPISEGYRIYSRKRGFAVLHTITQIDRFIGVFASDKWGVILQDDIIQITKK